MGRRFTTVDRAANDQHVSAVMDAYNNCFAADPDRMKFLFRLMGEAIQGKQNVDRVWDYMCDAERKFVFLAFHVLLVSKEIEREDRKEPPRE